LSPSITVNSSRMVDCLSQNADRRVFPKRRENPDVLHGVAVAADDGEQLAVDAENRADREPGDR
jgi:hypothetical protein